LDGLVRALGAARLTAAVRTVEADQLFDVRLCGVLPDLPLDAEVRIWPVTLAPECARAVSAARDGTVATFERVSFEALTAFVAFEVVLRAGALTRHRRFTVSVELVGAPEDRTERLLRSFLKDRRQVLRLLLLILMDAGADVSRFIQATRHDERSVPRTWNGWDEATLLETLLLSLSRNPDRVEQAACLIAGLERTPEGRRLLPDRLEEIWRPICAVREELRR
jgi:hypothetical protein